MLYYDKFVSTDETVEDVNKIALKKGYLEAGDMVISLAAMPIQEKGMVNTLRVTEVVKTAKTQILAELIYHLQLLVF